MKLKHFAQHHAVASYFILVYAIAWGGILLAVRAFASEADPTAMVAVAGLPMLIAPGIAGATVAALAEGRAGLSAMRARMTRWRAEPRWYAVALATLPLLTLAILYALALLIAPAFAPTFSLVGLAALLAGFFEEIGWTGFAIPRMRSQHGPLAVGLSVGLLWGLWHALADFSVRGSALGWFWPITFALFVMPLVAWRVLMVWVYDKTESGVVAQIMHFSYTGSLMMFVPKLSRTDDALVYATLAAALWAGVAILAIGRRRAARMLRPQTS